MGKSWYYLGVTATSNLRGLDRRGLVSHLYCIIVAVALVPVTSHLGPELKGKSRSELGVPEANGNGKTQTGRNLEWRLELLPRTSLVTSTHTF